MCIVSGKHKGFHILNSYKAQGVIEDITNRVVDHIRPGPSRLDWDNLMTTMDIVEKFEEVKICLLDL